MKNSTTAFDKFLSPYKTKENLSKENRNTKTYELSFVTELCKHLQLRGLPNGN
jgi:hypothetical protein